LVSGSSSDERLLLLRGRSDKSVPSASAVLSSSGVCIGPVLMLVGCAGELGERGGGAVDSGAEDGSFKGWEESSGPAVMIGGVGALELLR
jgi:hypothetical protein